MVFGDHLDHDFAVHWLPRVWVGVVEQHYLCGLGIMLEGWVGGKRKLVRFNLVRLLLHLLVAIGPLTIVNRPSFFIQAFHCDPSFLFRAHLNESIDGLFKHLPIAAFPNDPNILNRSVGIENLGKLLVLEPYGKIRDMQLKVVNIVRGMTSFSSSGLFHFNFVREILTARNSKRVFPWREIPLDFENSNRLEPHFCTQG
jgi:hypothetical protein